MRKDIHRESQFNPLDYRFVFSFAQANPTECSPGYNNALLRASAHNRPEQEPVYSYGFGRIPTIVEWRTIQPLPRIAGRFFRSTKLYQCDVCGARYKYGDVWQHIESGEVITIGHECADKFGAMVDRSDLDAYRKEQARVRKLGRELAKRRDNLRKFVATAGHELLKALRSDHRIVRDIRTRVIKFGSISDKQKALVIKLATEQQEKASRPEEQTVPAQINGKRQTITGEVLSCKWYESDYGDTFKMTVKVKTNGGYWLAWGTCPTAILDEVQLASDLRGSTVRFDAALKPGRDEHFALFSRPTKATIVKR